MQPKRKPPPLWAHQVPEYQRSLVAMRGSHPEPEPEPEPPDAYEWAPPAPTLRTDPALVLGGVPRERSGQRRRPPPLWAHQVPGSSYPQLVASARSIGSSPPGGGRESPGGPVASALDRRVKPRAVRRAVSQAQRSQTPDRPAAASPRPGVEETSADREAELQWWWDEEIRQQADRLNLIEDGDLHDFFEAERDRTVYFSGACMEILPSAGMAGGERNQQRQVVVVISKRALYRMKSTTAAAGRAPTLCSPAEGVGARLLLRNVTCVHVWSQSDEQLAIEYQQPDGTTARRLFLVSDGRRDQAVLALQKAVAKLPGSGWEVPVQVSSHALFSAGAAGDAGPEQPLGGFTKDTYGDNPVREGDDSAELCFTTLTGMVSAITGDLRGSVALPSRAASSVNRFAEEVKEIFPAAGSGSTPPHRYRDFEFTTYAPEIFRQIRALAGVSEQQYLSGITGVSEGDLFGRPPLIPRGAMDEFLSYGLPEEATLCPMFTNSKSGAFFFFTTDMGYLVKTVGPDEVKVLRDMLPEYLEHYQRNPGSLINKIVGAYSSSLCKEPFIVMESTFPLAEGVTIHEVYDLKGSVHGTYYTVVDHLPLISSNLISSHLIESIYRWITGWFLHQRVHLLVHIGAACLRL